MIRTGLGFVFTVLLFFSLSYSTLSAQVPCGFDLFSDVHDDQWIDEGLSISAFGGGSALHTLPIVFHIVSENNQGDVPDAEVLAALQNLNEAFENIGFYDPNTGVDTEIQFCLVKQDPSGLATTGITRTESPLTNVTAENEDKDLKALIHWDPLCYINVYIVNEIESASAGAGVRGYANFPSGHGAPTDGIVVESRTIGQSKVNTTVLIHEMGHYLGLYHTFNGGCTNNDCLQDGDRICDTPPDNSTAPAPCSDAYNSCTTDAQSGLPSDMPDPINNYMDYGYQDCHNEFTLGQKERMKMAIMNVRSSLLNCESCEEPCPQPITSTIKYDSLTAAIGAPYILSIENPVANTIINWTINGTSAGNGTNLNPNFTVEGTYIIILDIQSPDGKCVKRDTIQVDVYCGIDLEHTLKDTACVEDGATLTFTANAMGAAGNVEWFINNMLVSSGPMLNWTNPGIGVYEIYVEATNGSCIKRSFIYKIYVGCKEICDNNIDDDGDGLLDGFDPDCCDTINNFFFDPCYLSCPFEIKDAFTSIKTKWVSTGVEWHDANTPLIGDVDNDGEVEIVGLETAYYPHGQIASRDIIIVNGKTGVVEANFDTDEFGPYSRNISMADTDGDGYVEIYMNHPGISRYDLTPGGQLVKQWQAPGGGYEQPNITDFDEDGLPEIFMNNGIFDAATGQTFVAENNGINMGTITYPAGNSGSAAVDVLPDNFCPNCTGKELIVGNQVYSVGINRSGFSLIRREVQANGGADGYTSIADFDLDGDLDAAILYTTDLPNFSSTRNVVIWDIQTPNLLSPVYSWDNMFNRVAHLSVGDVTGDGKPEIAISSYSTIRCIGLDASGNWQEYFVNNNNDRSGMSGCAMFDFDADGRMEVYHRDERDLRIIEGSTGRVLFETPCVSGTGYDIPTVADIDGDGEAELVCSCNGNVQAFEPNPGTWALTRPVWNQLLYNVVNVNDDLTIPPVQQLHHLPGANHEFNFYIGQFGTKEHQASDLQVTFIEQTCLTDSMITTVEICNLGPATFNDVLKTSYYASDPRTTVGSVIWTYDTLITVLRPDSCFITSFKWPRFLPTSYLVINDDGSIVPPYQLSEDFPSTGIDECDFENNILQLLGVSQVGGPDLGPDTIMCDNGTLVLDAGSGYYEYEWFDGNTDQKNTIFGPGKYWVTVRDVCGAEYSDTIIISVDQTTEISLGNDRLICNGDSLVFQLSSSGNILWTPSLNVDCPTCPDVVVKSDTNLTLSVLVETKDGCFAFDSIHIIVGDGYEETDSLTICETDSVNIKGEWYYPGDVAIETSGSGADCDSTVRTYILGETIDLNLGNDINICSGDSVIFNLSQYDSISWNSHPDITCADCPIITVKPNQSTTFSAMVFSENGCMAMDELMVVVSDTIRATDTLSICYGDSVFVSGQWIKDETTIREYIPGTIGCDTILALTVELITEDLNFGPDQNICLGDTIVLNNPLNLTLNFSTLDGVTCASCPEILIHPMQTTTYVIEALTAENCELRDTLTITVEQQIIRSDTSLICISSDSTLVFGQWISEPGTYTQGNGESCDTLFVHEVSLYPDVIISLPDTIYAEEGEMVFINVQGNVTDISDYQWQSLLDLSCLTCETPTLIANESGLVTLTGTSIYGCTSIHEVFILVKKEEGRLYIPNVFSPDGDGLNDRITIFSNDSNAHVDVISIYDRWGELVYRAENIPAKDWEGWAGTFDGKLLNPAVYVISVQGEYSDGSFFSFARDVTLIR